MRDITHRRTRCGQPYAAVLHTGYAYQVTCKACLRAELAQIKENQRFLLNQEMEVLKRMKEI
jgi:hypothetical protein